MTAVLVCPVRKGGESIFSHIQGERKEVITDNDTGTWN
jgi:hypothetical protein